MLSYVLQIQHDSKQGYWILCHMVSSYQRCPKGHVSRRCPPYIYRGPARQSSFARSHKSHIRTAEETWASFPELLLVNNTLSESIQPGHAIRASFQFSSRHAWESTPSNHLFAFFNFSKWYADEVITTSLILFIWGILRHRLPFKQFIKHHLFGCRASRSGGKWRKRQQIVRFEDPA